MATLHITNVSSWSTATDSSLTASSFAVPAISGNGFGVDNSQHPDFSASGGAITFGLFNANFTSGGFSETDAGFDNWFVGVNVPEPSTIMLLGLGLTAFSALKRKRTNF